MTKNFHFDSLGDHDLYHLRYGRGAVIVAVPKQSGGFREKHFINSDTDVARAFNRRLRNERASAPDFEDVISISEDGELVRVVLRFEWRDPGQPSYRPVNAVIERILPVEQVTLEIVRQNESE